jgi:hypothetical protein
MNGMQHQARAVTSVPMAPAARISLACTAPGQYCAFSATMKTVPAALAAARMRAQAARSGAIGFSSST